MKNTFILFIIGAAALLGITTVLSCNQPTKVVEERVVDVVLQDYGPQPVVLDIDAYTLANENFRTALWTGKNMQVTLMSIPVNGEVGLEMHPNIEQFLRIEEGSAEIFMGDTKETIASMQTAEADFAIFVPAGKWHNVVNIGDKPLKLYSIYSPVEHPHSTVHKTFEEAQAAEHHHE